MRRQDTRGPGPLLALALFAILLGGQGSAAESSTKRELAIELLRVSGGGDMAQQISQAMLSSIRQSYSAMVDQVLASEPDLTAEQKRAVEKRLADFDRFSERFSVRLDEEIDFDAILQQVYVPLYEEHFTESELREILAFQSSPVGRKAVSVMPKLMQEGMVAAIPLIQPAIMKITGEILQEEQAAALRNVESR